MNQKAKLCYLALFSLGFFIERLIRDFLNILEFFTFHFPYDRFDPLSRARSIEFISAVVGSVLAIFLMHRCKNQLSFAAIELLMAVVFVIYPLCASFKLFYGLYAVKGFFSVILTSFPTLLLIEIFRNSKYKGTYLQIFYFIGTSFDGLIFTNWIYPSLEKLFRYDHDGTDQRLYKTEKYKILWVPFLIVVSVKLLIGLSLVYGSRASPIRKKDLEPAEDEASIVTTDVGCIYEIGKQDLQKEYSILFLLFICFIAGIELFVEDIYRPLPMYNYIRGKDLSENLKDLITVEKYDLISQISKALSNLINIFLTLVIATHTMIFINLFTLFTGILFIFIGKSLSTAILANILISYGASNLFPMMLILVEERIRMCPRKVSIIFSSQLIIALWMQSIEYNWIPSYRSKYPMIGLIFGGFSFLLYTVLVLYLERKRLTNESLLDYIRNHLLKNTSHLNIPSRREFRASQT